MCSVSSLSTGVFKEQLYGYMMEILKTSEWETRWPCLKVLNFNLKLNLSFYESKIKYNYTDLGILLE